MIARVQARRERRCPAPHNLVPLAWSLDGSRIFGYGGFDAKNLSDMGTFTVSSADGGDQIKLLPARSDLLERPDFVLVSPDRAKLLVNRQERGQDGEVLIVDGAVIYNVTPPGTFSCEFPNWDFSDRGEIEETWSPDGSAVALCAFDVAADGSTLWVAGTPGSGTATKESQIVGPATGAVSVQWCSGCCWAPASAPGLAGRSEIVTIGRQHRPGAICGRPLFVIDGQWYVGNPNGNAQWAQNLAASGSAVIVKGRVHARVTAFPLADGPERDRAIRATSRQPPPASLVYRLGRRHISAVGTYFRLEPDAQPPLEVVR